MTIMTLPLPQTESTITPRLVETFNISVRKGIAVILSQSSIPRHKREPLFQLGALYSPLVLVISLDDENNHEIYSYDFKANEPGFDLAWALDGVRRFEEGWHINQDGVLLSPQPSTINQSSLMDVLVQASKAREPLAS